MDYDRVIERLIEMKGRYDIGFSSIDRSFLDSLHYDLFGTAITNTGCSDCYRDAYMEISIKLKKDKKMPEKSKFELKPGAVIVFFGESKAYTNANLTDEVAVRFLSLNHENRRLFTEEIPSNWEEMVSEYKKHCSNDNADSEAISNERSEVAEKDARISELEVALAEMEVAKCAAEVERDNLRSELAEANKSLESALSENESLKSSAASATKPTRSKRAKTENTETTESSSPAGESTEQTLDLGE